MVAPIRSSSSGATPFTVPWVPTGMNDGVATSPWGVVNTPARAAPSVRSSRKSNIRGGRAYFGVEARSVREEWPRSGCGALVLRETVLPGIHVEGAVVAGQLLAGRDVARRDGG